MRFYKFAEFYKVTFNKYHHGQDIVKTNFDR